MDGIEIGTGKQEEKREDRSSPAELVFSWRVYSGCFCFCIHWTECTHTC